jgi:hypothetical protein
MYPLTEDFSELGQFDLDRRSIQRLPLDYCTRHSVVVLGKIDGAGSEPITVGVAANDPEKVVADIKRKLRREVTPVHLNLFEINRALDYGFSRQLNAQASRGHILNLSSERATADSTPRALANDMLLLAVRHSASDIHLEVYPDDVDVRLRIDGVLHQTFTHISPANVSGVVNRLKVMTGLDITEHRHPQDGRLRATLIDGERHSDLDYRVNVLPGPGGEDIVLRLANSDDSVMSVEQLGMTPAIQERFLGLLSNPEGLILVTGPTGSGKTTTLYTALQQINDGTKKILTAEDPIEFFLPKVNQKQVMPNLSMGDLARAFMRQDPDVILIGEIRDHETASTAAKAAATGHVVLGTLDLPRLPPECHPPSSPPSAARAARRGDPDLRGSWLCRVQRHGFPGTTGDLRAPRHRRAPAGAHLGESPHPRAPRLPAHDGLLKPGAVWAGQGKRGADYAGRADPRDPVPQPRDRDHLAADKNDERPSGLRAEALRGRKVREGSFRRLVGSMVPIALPHWASSWR